MAQEELSVAYVGFGPMAEMLQVMLADAGIQVVLQDKSALSGGFKTEVTVLVRSGDLEKAKLLVQGFSEQNPS